MAKIRAGELCRSCASQGPTCCQPAYGASVTLHDAKRLLRLTGEKPAKVLQLRRIRSRTLLEGLHIDPWFRMLFIGRDRLLQVRQRGLDCRFLGPGGCTIFASRPRLCRLHPFWFGLDDDGALRISWDGIDTEDEARSDGCQVARELYPSIRDGLASVGETPWTFLGEARSMMEELDWHRRAVKRLGRSADLDSIPLRELLPAIETAPLFEV